MKARLIQACAVLLAMLSAVPATSLDLKAIMQGVKEQAGIIWQQRDILLGDVTEAEERKMGRAGTAVLLGAAPLVDDVKLQRYVNRVGLWLAMQTEREDLVWRFGVIDDDTINAFAAPGGYVLITRGLFLALRNEAELAGVLAHEIGHVVAKHHVAAMVSKARVNLLAEIAKGASGHEGELPEALLSASKSLYASGLDRADELEADRLGVVIAARAGYDPYGLVHLLKTLRGAAQDTDLMGLLLTTHPPFDTRLDALDRAMGTTLDDIEGRKTSKQFLAVQRRLR